MISRQVLRTPQNDGNTEGPVGRQQFLVKRDSDSEAGLPRFHVNLTEYNFLQQTVFSYSHSPVYLLTISHLTVSQ